MKPIRSLMSILIREVRSHRSLGFLQWSGNDSRHRLYPDLQPEYECGNCKDRNYQDGKYTGSVSRSFKIVKKNLANCTYSSVSGFDYDGTEKTPTVTIKNGTRTLSRGTDYTLQYKNNKNAGVGQVIVSGAGNYSGTVIRYFNINVLQPTGLRMESSKANSVKLVWSFSGKSNRI